MSAPALELTAHDHPEANGKTPLPGAVEYKLFFVLDNGRKVTIRIGQPGFDALGQMLLDMMAEAPSYGNGQIDIGAANQTKIADGITLARDVARYVEASQYWRIEPHDQKERHAFNVGELLRRLKEFAE